jgi:hypothetical protein
MYFSKFDDVLFVEGDPPGVQTIRPISTQHDGIFSQSQLKSLDTLKRVMAAEAKRAGGNAIIQFTYGQRNTFWRSLLSIDDVWWHASGVIANVNESALRIGRE